MEEYCASCKYEWIAAPQSGFPNYRVGTVLELPRDRSKIAAMVWWGTGRIRIVITNNFVGRTAAAAFLG
jgi:hypothetical protein